MNQIIPTPVVEERLAPEIQSIKNLAVAKIDNLNKLKEERKEKREKLNEMLRSDETYTATENAARDRKKALDEIKARLMTDPELAALEADIKELNSEINEHKKDVGDYLVMYADKTGQLSFLHPDGNEIKIERTAKPKVIITKKGESQQE